MNFAHKYVWLCACAFLAAFKLWLTRAQGIYVIGSAGLDDRLFIELAQHILQGDWLGPYTVFTLAKGPAYPIFIATCAFVGLPLFAAQHLFYIAASFILVIALTPAIRSQAARFALFALLICNPMTFDAPGMGRVLRQHIYGPLVLLIFAGLVALYLRRKISFRRNLPWMILMGLAGGAFYLTREETIWLIPSVALLASACVVAAWRTSRESFKNCLCLLGTAVGCASVPIVAVSSLNLIHYGWFGTCEFRANSFKDAYGAMARVEVGPTLAHVPINHETRNAMAKVSPAFAEIQQVFDQGLAQAWAAHSEFFTGLPPAREEIGGGWYMWALREAVRQAGHADNAAEALAFYRRVADEINTACDAGILPAGAPRSGFAPILHSEDVDRIIAAIRNFVDFVARFRHFGARTPPSTGSPEQLQLFANVTGERLQPIAGALDTISPKQFLSYQWRIEILQTAGQKLRFLLLGLVVAAQVIALISLLLALIRRRWTFPFTLAAAAWGACASSILIHAVIHATSFPVRSVTSFAPIYPLLILFVFAVSWHTFLLWRQRLHWFGKCSFSLDTEIKAPLTLAESRHASMFLPITLGLCALAPFLIWSGEFKKLFWFGDDLFLLDQLAYMGLWDWTWRAFAENFVPLFKFIWGGIAIASDGSYIVMLWFLWLTHALSTALFARWLRHAGFAVPSIIVCTAVFALTPANLETLGWSVQWSAVLAVHFLLLALWWFESHRHYASQWSWKLIVPLIVFVSASACSFSRGVLTGGIIATALLIPLLTASRRVEWLPRLLAALVCLAPAVAVALVITSVSSGNHQHLEGTWLSIVRFSAAYFLYNPGHTWFYQGDAGTMGWVLLGVLKLALIICGLRCAHGSTRQALILLLIYDLGNAVLLGVGRHHTGLLAALSSRYQYSALLAALPFYAAILDALWSKLDSTRIRRLAFVGTSLAVTIWCLAGWPSQLREFCAWRGSELRALLAAPATADPNERVPALDYMHVERAKALQRAFHLH